MREQRSGTPPHRGPLELATVQRTVSYTTTPCRKSVKWKASRWCGLRHCIIGKSHVSIIWQRLACYRPRGDTDECTKSRHGGGVGAPHQCPRVIKNKQTNEGVTGHLYFGWLGSFGQLASPQTSWFAGKLNLRNTCPPPPLKAVALN